MPSSLLSLMRLAILMPLALGIGEARVLKNRQAPALVNAFHPRSDRPTGPQTSCLDDPKTLFVTCNDFTNEDGSTEQSIIVTDRSNVTGHSITLRVQQRTLCRGEDCDLTSSQELFYDDVNLLKQSTFTSGGTENITLHWGELVRGMSTAQYLINRDGVITGFIDDRKLKPFTAETSRNVTFVNGEPVPRPEFPNTINETLSNVTPNLISAMSQCGPQEEGLTRRSGELQIRDKKSCTRCKNDALKALGIATAVCVASFSWWNWVGLAICEASAVAVYWGIIGNCYSHKLCP